MSLLKITSVLALFVINSSAIADNDKSSLILEYIELSGLRTAMIDAKKQELENMEESADQLLDSLVQKHPELSAKHRKQAHKAYLDYWNSVAASSTVEDSINKWIEVYESRLSKSELEELVKFHNTEIGRKSVEAALLGTKEYSLYIYGKQNEGIKKAEPVLSERITSIISEHQTEKMSWVGKSVLYILEFFEDSSDTDN